LSDPLVIDGYDLRALAGQPIPEIMKLPRAVQIALRNAEVSGQLREGDLPLDIEADRNRVMESPSYLATDILDPYYKENFSARQLALMDEVIGPYLMGEEVRIEGVNYDPKQYTGLGILFSRTTYKSTILRIMAQWIALYRKLRLGEDSRTMFTHQVLEKAIEHSEAVRNICKLHDKFRATFPEFRAHPSKEWDTKAKWRYPCFKSYQATEWSWTCYGETSSKIGGHYTERLTDDWVTDESVTTDTQLEQSWQRFVAMDHLRTRDRPYNPWVFCGTHYHFQDTYKRLENQGGWLIWRVPGHTGSPKRIFDICAVEDRSPEGRRKIEARLRALENNPPGELNFPQQLPWRELYRTARTTGPQEYNCQILLNPMPEGEQRFDKVALEQGWVDQIPGPEQMWLYVRVDPAISESRQADETAIIVGGVEWDAKRYIIDGWIGREKRPTEIVRKIFTLARAWQAKNYMVKNIGIESVQYQEALAELCRRGVPEREPAYHGESVPMFLKPCPVRSIKRSPDKRKQERILEMDGPVTRRELKFWKQCSISQKVMLQFMNFPFDRFDALDATHDLWEGTMTPPAVIEDQVPRLHKELQKLLRAEMYGKRQGVNIGTNNRVNLTGWR
jgi:hypothetical protein